jgi:hypothetical protein
MKRWILALLVAMLGVTAVGCQDKDLDDDDDGASLKVDVDKK